MKVNIRFLFLTEVKIVSEFDGRDNKISDLDESAKLFSLCYRNENHVSVLTDIQNKFLIYEKKRF